MRAAVYARVSSAAQRDAHTVESQLHVLGPYVRAQGWTLVETYVDDGRSAKTGQLEHRDAWARLMRDAEASRFDVVVVLDVNRLTRTGSIEERAQILGPLQRLGVQIATPSGGILDLRSFLGELYVTMQALVAAEENRKKAEAVKAGKLRAIAEGRKPAGPTPYGLHYERATGTWSIDEAAAAIVREVYRRVIAGESCMVIADDLHARAVRPPRGEWARKTVWQLARSRHVIGEWTADKARRLVIAVPAIIDHVTWQAAQQKLTAHGKRGLARAKHVYLLQGLAVCGSCGSPISIRSATPQRRGRIAPAAYVCRARKLERRGERRCNAPILDVAEADARVWARLETILTGPELAAEVRRRSEERSANRRAWEDDVATYRSRLERLVKHEAAVLARWRRGSISDEAVDLELAAVAREKAAVSAQLATAERAAAARDEEPLDDADAWVGALRDLARTMQPEARQRVVRAIVRAGGARFEWNEISLTLRIAPSRRVHVPAESAGYRMDYGTDITIRVVA